ncbi:MAG: hypothetical protein JWM82_1689 [Myxococcales bacterium]|nr:hypothetical protein [Myxococcales bacterium]
MTTMIKTAMAILISTALGASVANADDQKREPTPSGAGTSGTTGAEGSGGGGSTGSSKKHKKHDKGGGDSPGMAGTSGSM